MNFGFEIYQFRNSAFDIIIYTRLRISCDIILSVSEPAKFLSNESKVKAVDMTNSGVAGVILSLLRP